MTGTATSRALAGAIVALGLAIAGCGGQARVAASDGGFGWLRPASAPTGWRAAAIPSGAAMSFPPQWKRVSGDAGTATAVLMNGEQRIIGYLNVTPRQGDETLLNWSRFRIDHNGDEGDRSIRRLDARSGLRFRDGRGSCVRDSYATGSGNRYIELACLVAGRRGTTVIVAASPPQTWRQISPTLERSISSFTT